MITCRSYNEGLSLTGGGAAISVRAVLGEGDTGTHLLQEEHDPLDHVSTQLLQAEDCARGADEHLGLAIGHVMLKSTALQQTLHRLAV